MKILTIAATELEIKGVQSGLKEAYKSLVDFEVTGVGCVATTYNLTKKVLTKDYDYVIMIGIAGSFDPKLKPGMVCQVRTEMFGDLGSEEIDGRTITQFELGLTPEDHFPFNKTELVNQTLIDLDELQSVKASTVNKTLGTKQSIEFFTHKYHDIQIESLEGAALFYVCISQKLKFIELRSISNFVEPRNRESWQIPLALASLNEMYFKLIEKLIE